MKKSVLILFLLLSLSLLFGETPDQILRNIDNNTRLSGSDISLTITMIEEDPENGIEKSVIQSFRNDDEDAFLMLIKEPEVQLGQGYLKVEENLWFYDPESRKFTHTSLKESFEGSDAKNSDFEASSYAEDYSVESIDVGTLGKYEVYIMELKALNNEVSYPFLKMWVTRDSNLVLKIEEYSLTKRLLRSSYYPSYTQVGGSFIADRMIFIDALVEGKKTSITLSNISTAELPEYVFTKAYVERVNR